MNTIEWLRLGKSGRANLRAFWAGQAAYLQQIESDPGIPALPEYCWDSAHQGGWACRDCWQALTDPERASLLEQEQAIRNGGK